MFLRTKNIIDYSLLLVIETSFEAKEKEVIVTDCSEPRVMNTEDNDIRLEIDNYRPIVELTSNENGLIR